MIGLHTFDSFTHIYLIDLLHKIVSHTFLEGVGGGGGGGGGWGGQKSITMRDPIFFHLKLSKQISFQITEKNRFRLLKIIVKFQPTSNA